MPLRRVRLLVICALCASNFFACASFGEDAEQEYSATTVSNPQIRIEDLQSLLKPLTRAELIVEAEAWLELLKEKVAQISNAEIQMREKSREIDKKEDEIARKVSEIKEGDKQEVEKAAEAAEDINETVETIGQAEAEIRQIAADTEAKLNGKSEEELNGTEEDLKEKTEEVVEATGQIKDTIQEIAQSDIDLTEKVKKIGKAEVELHSKVKEQVLMSMNKLREEQTALIDRFNTVLAALKNKGGDVKEYEQYVAAVSGLNLGVEDIKDVGAFRIIVWGWLKSTEGGIRWLKNIFFFIVTLIVFYILASLAGRVTERTVSASKRFSDLLKQFFVSVTRKIVIIIGFVIALSMLEINIGPFLAGMGVAGFILGFALQGTLSNFASGLMILIYRPYDVGQIIDAAGVKGTVSSMNLVSTTIKTFDNQVVIVPNGEIWGGVITNVTGSTTRRVDMVFGISYTDDISKAASVLEDIVSKHELVLEDPEPVVRLHELGDSSVNFVCRPWVKTADYWTVYWDVTRAVKERFDAENISIPFPQRDVHLYKTDADA